MAASSSKIASFGDHVPPDKTQRLVETPYGEGLVFRTTTRSLAKNETTVVYEIQLTDWKRAEGSHNKPATLYSTIQYPSIKPQVGHDVLCFCYGRGKVVDVRDDGILVVRLSHWRLARRNVVTCYVTPDKVQVVRHKQIYEMTVPEKIEHGQALKQEASKHYAAKDYKGALESYAKAVDTVRYVQHKPDSTNETRADLLILMITCSNNAATCCLQTHQFDNAANFANNALTMIQALEGKVGMKIHSLLNSEGFSDMTLFGEYKIKSLLVLAKASLEKKNTADALQFLKQAHTVAQQFTSEGNPSKALQAFTKEISKLYTTCKGKRQEEKILEKKRAKAMFAAAPVDSSKGDGDVLKASISQHKEPTPSAQPMRESASPTSVVDRSEQQQHGPDEDTSPSDRKDKQKKRVSFSSDVKQTKEDAEDAFYVAVGAVGLAILAVAAVGCTVMLRKPRG